MAYVLPTVDDFLAKFPELFDTAFYDQVKVQDALDEAARSVDTTWLEGDYQNAILYLAAHLFITDPAITGSGGMASTAGNIQSESLGLISVTYAQGGAQASAATLMQEDLATTVYGRKYLRLLRLNHPAIITI